MSDCAPDRRDLDLDNISLTTSQRLLARSYWFAGWPRPVRHLEIITEFTRAPEPPGDEPDSNDPSRPVVPT